MTTTKQTAMHTKEPWQVDGIDNTVVSAGRGPLTRRWIARCEGAGSAANAARIVACVNGCEGIPNPAAMKELLAAAKAARDDAPFWLARISAAIAAVEGK